jgi:hypothetical protein
MNMKGFTLLEENSPSSSMVKSSLFPDERAMVEGFDEESFPKKGFLPKGKELVIANRGEDFNLFHRFEADDDFDVFCDPTSELLLVGSDMVFSVGPSPTIEENSEDLIRVEIQL